MIKALCTCLISINLWGKVQPSWPNKLSEIPTLAFLREECIHNTSLGDLFKSQNCNTKEGIDPSKSQAL